MKFYRLHPPQYHSYREETRRNGWGGWEIGMPGVDCSVCGDTRGLPGHVIPYRLPESLEREFRERDRSPIPEDAHRALRERVEGALRELHPDMPPMPPGADFPPLDWGFPAAPADDIYWSGGPAVSARLAAALGDMGATGFHLIHVDRVRVGIPPPEEDDRVSSENGHRDSSPDIYFLSISAQGRLNSRMKQKPSCPGCGYAVVERGYRWERWEDGIADGNDIFYFPTTAHIVVTERVAELLNHLGTANFALTLLKPGVEVFVPSYRRFASGIGRLIPWLAWWDIKRSGLS